MPGSSHAERTRLLQTVAPFRARSRATSDILGARPAALVADTIVAVGFSASLWWAAQDGQTTLLEAFHMALSALGEAAAESRAM